jgi:hypothetical protein
MDKRQNTLIEDIESELKKDSSLIDGDLIDRSLDELYALSAVSPPCLSGEALEAAARTVRARHEYRRRNALAKRRQKRRFTRSAVRGIWAACFTALFLFSANYVTTLATGSCLPSKIGIKLCCGTKYCLCETDEPKEAVPPE